MAVQLTVRTDDQLVEHVDGREVSWRSCLGPYPAVADCDECGRPCRSTSALICEEDETIVVHLNCTYLNGLPLALPA